MLAVNCRLQRNLSLQPRVNSIDIWQLATIASMFFHGYSIVEKWLKRGCMLDQDTINGTYHRLREQPDIAIWKRFCSKISYCENVGCWEWKGTKSHGYGQFFHQRSQRAAHVVIMKWFVGSIPDGLVVDHFKCDNRSCVNPDHLKIVTRAANVLRSNGITGLQVRKTVCSKGHPLSGDNLRLDGHGRRCRTCKSDYNREYGKKRKKKFGKREPVSFTTSEQALLGDRKFASTLHKMLNPPDEKTWLRFIGYITPNPITDCWLFGLSKIDGYGQFGFRGKTWKPHRLIRAWIDGVIPQGYDVHHICYNRSCVNPEHLQAISPSENILDSKNTLAGRNARKTHCPSGHPYSGDNLMIIKNKRHCRACHDERDKNYPVEKKRKYALRSYYKNMENPNFREKKRVMAAEYRKKRKIQKAQTLP